MCITFQIWGCFFALVFNNIQDVLGNFLQTLSNAMGGAANASGGGSIADKQSFGDNLHLLPDADTDADRYFVRTNSAMNWDRRGWGWGFM